MNTLVSVVIAAYNASQTLPVAIESALQQQGCDVELLIVDDCSTDNTLTIATQLAMRDNRIRVFQTPDNRGPGAARNLALLAAKGQWIAVLDADDRFAPYRLATLLAVAQHQRRDMVIDSYYLTKAGEHIPSGSRFTSLCSQADMRSVSATDFVSLGLGSTKPLIRTVFLRSHQLRFNPAIKCGEDLLLYSQLLIAGASCTFVNLPLYYRTESAGSLSRKNKVQSLSALANALILLHNSVSKTSLSPGTLSKAIGYRMKVTNDALAAAKWRYWMASPRTAPLPSLRNAFELIRHVCFRKVRYATKSL
ncbi:glycosyltransferase family 2 protein [Aestuariibacter sp. GS-14]|uniref:glycosyltransferase family 2 protein n=1 Tax=Aestuariibacter sp. GS-14 TaxID=2590670 RepID=UPI00112E7A67|nr:glycosyltransferase family 2 protein [Aestuariibacter sp. GS-14]TPV53673.1 glycosyltransferase family 2 protein [Aestuariibacter sp. GS-14]